MIDDDFEKLINTGEFSEPFLFNGKTYHGFFDVSKKIRKISGGHEAINESFRIITTTLPEGLEKNSKMTISNHNYSVYQLDPIENNLYSIWLR